MFFGELFFSSPMGSLCHTPGMALSTVRPTSVIKLWLENHIFTFLTSSLKQTAGGISYYTRRLLKPSPLYFVQIMVPTGIFGRTLNMKKCKNFVSVYKTFKKFSFPTLINIILRYCTQIVLVLNLKAGNKL